MVLSMNRWKGKVAIVSGASSGVGATIAEHLVDNGITVAGLARRKDKLDGLSKKLVGKPGKFYAIQADVTKEEDIKKAVKWTKENLGPIHILINSAGLTKDGSLLEGKTDDWLLVFQTNVVGLSTITREVIQNMEENNVAGHIIHINSILGHYVLNLPNLNVYPASKYAVTALTETLRRELNMTNSSIKITSISPGAIDTDFAVSNEGQSDSFKDAFDKLPKLKTEDVADAVVYALSTPPYVQVHDLLVRNIKEAV